MFGSPAGREQNMRVELCCLGGYEIQVVSLGHLVTLCQFMSHS